MSDKAHSIADSYLIRGKNYLAQDPDFNLVEREEDLVAATDILMRRDRNNLILTGVNGVGLSSLMMGVQASKENPEASVDIIGKRFYWLNVDRLFSTGDPAKITEAFNDSMATLRRYPDTVLVIDNMRGFVDGANKSGCSHLINALMYEARTNHDFQLALVVPDTDLPEVLKCHSNMHEIFVTHEVKEPSGDGLKKILLESIKKYEKFHGIPVDPEAIDAVMKLTSKFYCKELDYAQPLRSLMVVDGALTSYRREAHSRPPELVTLEKGRENILSALAGNDVPYFSGKEPKELEADLADIETQISRFKEKRAAFLAELRKEHAAQRENDEALGEIDDRIKELREIKPTGPQSAQESEAGLTSFGKAGFDTPEIKELKRGRADVEKEGQEIRARYKALVVQANEGLILGPTQVMSEYSRISGIPANQLGQDETRRLLEMPGWIIENRLIGQDEPVKAVCEAIKRGRSGFKSDDEPIGSFLFLGPSGVGKTELARTLAEYLFFNPKALLRFDMSEYMEKHAVATMIGAPPGYDGYENGGMLTNAIRRRPYSVALFDEIEKAHENVFDIFLQILEDGRLTDRRGLTASFANALIVMTSNVGGEYFYDESMEFEDAKAMAMKDLEKKYRPEFLNRFTGIFCFNRLGMPEVIWIADKNFKKVTARAEKMGVTPELSRADLEAMCHDHHEVRRGARGIVNFMKTKVETGLSDIVLRNPGQKGVAHVTYDKETKLPAVKFTPAEMAVAVEVEQKLRAARPAAAKAFGGPGR